MFRYLSGEERVPPDHPLHAIRVMVDQTTLYYRVNDRVLKAQLLGNGRVGPPSVIAQADELRERILGIHGTRVSAGTVLAKIALVL